MSDAKPDQDFRNSNLSAPLDFEATYGDSLSDTDPVNVRLSYWPSGYRFGRYQIVRPIGGGTSAIVYLALDEKLGREVALKVARQQAGRSLDTGERFRREAQSVAKLEHPNLCAVFESGEHDGHLYISMAYIEGQSLAAWIQDRVPDELEVIRVVRAVALALAEAHESGIVHRDLKPANILMNRHG
ncbi:MAG: serine/threonine-protein kinase, partial [Planctomycetota bacterium]